jgi:hypothetical protein
MNSCIPCLDNRRFDAGWSLALRRLGFIPSDDGYRRDGVVARSVNPWMVLETSALRHGRGQSPVSPDRSGLWKRVGSGRNRRFLFELPAAAARTDVEDQALDKNEDLSPGSFLDWALACAAGAIPRDWRAPAGELVASWMPPGALTVRIGPLVRMGELVLTTDRWALSFPILPGVPADLPAARRRCLETLARDAQERWHMVRVGLVRTADGEALVGGLDLTGAPHSEFLFLAGLDGLRHVVSWLVETADFLADVAVTLRSLEICRPKTEKKERKKAA